MVNGTNVCGPNSDVFEGAKVKNTYLTECNYKIHPITEPAHFAPVFNCHCAFNDLKREIFTSFNFREIDIDV